MNRHCCSAPVMAQPGVFQSFFGVEGSAFLEIHGTNCRILWAVLDLARSFERSSSPGENFCGSRWYRGVYKHRYQCVAIPKGEALLRDPEDFGRMFIFSPGILYLFE